MSVPIRQNEDGRTLFSQNEDGLNQFNRPKLFTPANAGNLGDAVNPCASDPERIATRIHVYQGHGQARKWGKVLVDADGGNQRSLGQVGEVLSRCEICHTSEKAPHLPFTDASAATSFNEKTPVDLSRPGDAIALHAMAVYSRNPLLAQVGPRHPLEVRDVSSGSWVAVFGWRFS